MRFFVTTPKGLEAALHEELRAWGVPITEQLDPRSHGGLAFEGELEDAYRVCMFSRIAGRVLLELKSFPCADPDQLYGGVRSIHWTQVLSARGTLSVDFTSRASQLKHTHFGAQKVKDAIVDQFMRIKGSRPSVDKSSPDVRIHVHVVNDVATVSIDLSGESLHRRGYRVEQGLAPLKENLAAALLYYSGWAAELRKQITTPVEQRRKLLLVDPMVGSGTILLEALGMALEVPAGWGRLQWGFDRWRGHDAAAWERVRREARTRLEEGAKRFAQLQVECIGFDRSAHAMDYARANAAKLFMQAGQADDSVRVRLERKRWPEDWEQDAAWELNEGERGFLVMNPPYGERIGDVTELKILYRQMGDGLKKRFRGWTASILTGESELAQAVGLKSDRRTPLWNGPIECRLLTYSLF